MLKSTKPKPIVDLHVLKARMTLSPRKAKAAVEARQKASEIADRLAKGMTSIDIASLRKEGSDKVTKLRERAATIDTAELKGDAKELGDKALDGARDFAGKLTRSIISAIPKSVIDETKK